MEITTALGNRPVSDCWPIPVLQRVEDPNQQMIWSKELGTCPALSHGEEQQCPGHAVQLSSYFCQLGVLRQLCDTTYYMLMCYDLPSTSRGTS